MSRKDTFIYIVSLMLAATSCIDDRLAETNLQNMDASISLKGMTMSVFDPGNCQYAFNSARNEYRMHDDNMGQYIILQCSTRPANEGDSFTANLTYTTDNDIVKETGLPFVVQKTSQDGKLWIWNKTKKYGLVIMQLSTN